MIDRTEYATWAAEPKARVLKSIVLADLLDASHIDSASASSMSGAQWGLLAAAARVRIPSRETRQLVVMFLRGREAARLQLNPTPGENRL